MTAEDDRQYARMAEAVAYLANRWDRPCGLTDVATASGLSPWHFQRQFKRWIGVSPKQFQGFLTLGHAKASLKRDLPVLEAALSAGLSGPSRLHDLTVGFDATSPGEIKTGGGGLALRHGIAETPFGRIFVVLSPRGIVRLAFIEPGGEAEARSTEQQAWPRAQFTSDDAAAGAIADRLFSLPLPLDGRLPLAPRGTNFQVKVWQALMAIPPGAVVTYTMIARAIRAPAAARAVGGACAANPIAVLIPCHRVLRETGALGGYAFGAQRKRALVAWEAAAFEDDAQMPAPGPALFRTGAGHS